MMSYRFNSILRKLCSFPSKSVQLEIKYFYSTTVNNPRPKPSYFSSGSGTPLLGLTLGECIDLSAGKYPTREAVVDCQQNIRKTFTELKTDVDRLAAGFLALGLHQGDRIGIWSPNNYEWLLTQFASAKAGLISVCINPGYQQKELEYCLKKVKIKAIVSAESYKSQIYYDLLKSTIPTLDQSKSGKINDENIPDLRHIVMLSDKHYGGAYKFNDVLDIGSKDHFQQLETLQNIIQFDDPVNIQFTSGTTGSPKGATLTHHNIVNNGYFIGMRLGYHKKYHRICLPVPLYHCLGCVVGSTSALIHGACTILSSPTFSATAAVRAVQSEKATCIYGTPTMYIDILNLPDVSKYDLTSLETGIMTGSPCPAEIFKAAVTKLHIKDLTIGYGCTETSPVILATNTTSSLSIRSETVGLTLDHTEVKIVDKEGKIVPCGEQGELCTRGYLVMPGYWDDPQKTKEAITSSKWYKTGDLAVSDEEGNIKIIGRLKDMIIRGGENIYPREIEEILHTHESIAEVQVFGVPDKRMGEELCAWIKVKPSSLLSEEDVKCFCKGKMAKFKIPRYIMFVEQFPTTVTGKIQKFAMRDESIKKLKL